MAQDIITLKSGKIQGMDYLHHVDLRAYGAPRMLSIYIAVFDECSIILDSGSSNDTNKVLRYLKKNDIPLSSIKYIITSHHHFDHNGGCWNLYGELKKHDPEIKILTNQKTKELLNDYEYHLSRAKRTYGDLVGIMKPIEDSAFKIIEPTSIFSGNPNDFNIIEKFTTNGHEVKLAILKSPGHTHDHQSTVFIRNGTVDFIFLGESAGTIYHSTKLITMPTSMPVFYNHDAYMSTIENYKKLFPLKAGFSHFGVVNGKENVRKLLLEHEAFMKEFRSNIIEFYKQKPETKYVVDHILPLLTSRSDMTTENHPIFQGIALGIVYGMMMDLGYRKD